MRVEAPEVVRITLDRMRRAWNNNPEMLLETQGGHYTPTGAHAFIDLIGFDDELIDTIQVPSFPPYYLLPLMHRPRLTGPADDFGPSIRTARYEPTNAFAQAAIAPDYLPGWKVSDMTRFTVEICLKRYRRSA